MSDLKNNVGSFVISLDFELNWGVRDVYDISQYGKNLLNGREAIPKILLLFKRFQICATWATVGLLTFSNRKDLMNNLPDNLPSYVDEGLNPYNFIECIGDNEASDPYHYGYSLIREIEQTPGMEIGSHTFSHYYCLEKNNNTSAFYSDLQASHNAFSRLGITTDSLVFCRNQYDNFYINIAKKAGFKFFRGNERHWLYKPRVREDEGVFLRAMRLSDHYVNISGHNSSPITLENIINVQSSRFLRPLGPKALEKIRLFRIKAAMTEAAVTGECFHLWWHPHNFGKNVPLSLNFLEEILVHYNLLKDLHGMRSINMKNIMD
jgi:peptidoglycan/xylan/chitin deacetylase (PgdA/CDA1 family)